MRAAGVNSCDLAATVNNNLWRRRQSPVTAGGPTERRRRYLVVRLCPAVSMHWIAGTCSGLRRYIPNAIARALPLLRLRQPPAAEMGRISNTRESADPPGRQQRGARHDSEDGRFQHQSQCTFRNASIYAGEMTLWVMNRRAGHKLRRPVFPR
jgi:hypothetical protein